MRRSLPPVLLALLTCASAQDCTPELTSTVGALGAFGSTLAAQGGLLAVGAPEPDMVPGTSALHPYGRVELFQYDPDLPRWQPVDVLAPPPSPLTVVNHPGFASALALDGDTLLAGWPDDITGGNGTARPFRRTNGGWIAEPPLLPPFASATGRFGVAVAIEGDRCVVGEQLSDGFVHVFERAPSSGEWTYRQTLSAPAPGSLNGTFGRALALQDEWLFVGDPGHVGALHGAGQVVVFRRDGGGTWQPYQTLVSPSWNPLHADLFGLSLTSESNTTPTGDLRRRFYVGAPQELAPGGGAIGVVHELRLGGAPASWVFAQTLQSPAYLGAASFGWSIDRTGDALLVGAPDDAIGPAQTGAAHLFERDPVADTWSYTGRYTTSSSVGTPQPRAGAAVAVGGWHAAIGAPGAERVRVTPAFPQRDVDADNTTDACEARFDLADCWLLPNSTGRTSRIHVDGSVAVAAGNMQLAVDQLPLNAFGYFIVSRSNQIILPPGGLTQILCLGGPIGRVIGPGQVLNSGPAGRAHLTLDPRQIPTPSGPVSAQPGETWFFQFWHRDVPPPFGSRSGFTETARVRFE